jgi:glycosyltransferase involved in cell wall biosynthesis
VRIAFYAPLKAPDHPVPSGDRQIARSFIAALRLAGHDVALASRLRAFDAHGDAQRQARLRAIGGRLAERLVRRYRDGARPDLWFTYHVHHNAPDHLGAAVSRALDVPYVIAEASVAPRQRDGAWAIGYADALAAVRAADTIVCINPVDVTQVRAARAAGARCDDLAPFIDVDAFAGRAPRRSMPNEPARLVAVAMMRAGAKLASYRVLAQALAQLDDLPWTLDIVGDGPLRTDVEKAFARCASRVRFTGALPAPAVATVLRASDLFVWPAVDEAFGLAFIEAQACGLPVVGGDSPGVAAVVAAERTGLLVPPGDAVAFAAAVRLLLGDPALRERIGCGAFAYARERHDVHAAAAALGALLDDVRARHRSRVEAAA